jgi:hypothetical protein
MSTYLLVHRHPENYTPTAGTAAAWVGWFEELGSSLVDLGNPVFERTAVGGCGSSAPLGGYTLVTADDFDGAVALAERCPIGRDRGGVEVGLLTPVPGRQNPARIF